MLNLKNCNIMSRIDIFEVKLAWNNLKNIFFGFKTKLKFTRDVYLGLGLKIGI